MIEAVSCDSSMINRRFAVPSHSSSEEFTGFVEADICVRLRSVSKNRHQHFPPAHRQSLVWSLESAWIVTTVLKQCPLGQHVATFWLSPFCVFWQFLFLALLFFYFLFFLMGSPLDLGPLAADCALPIRVPVSTIGSVDWLPRVRRLER